jgi:hypothetical protein
MEQVVQRLAGASHPPKQRKKRKKEVVGNDGSPWPRRVRAHGELETKRIPALGLPVIRVRKYVKVTMDSAKTANPRRKERNQVPPDRVADEQSDDVFGKK